MTNTPLNPDALEVARNMLVFMCADGFTPKDEDLVKAIVTAYLDSAHPVVNSVEELDALPLGTTIQDSDEDCVLQALERGSILGTEWYIPGVEKIFTSKDVEFPARVLYRPETTNGR